MHHQHEQLSIEDALRATLAGYEFQYDLPPEVKDAMDAGLISTGNDRWMWSDNINKTNYLVLTSDGHKMAHKLGLTDLPSGAEPPCESIDINSARRHPRNENQTPATIT